MTAVVPHFGVVDDAPWLETCFHEAGHAVVARLLGAPVMHVKVAGELDGATMIDEPPMEEMSPRQVRDSQVISAAGAAASSRALVLVAHQSDGDAERWRRSPQCSGDRAMYAEAAGFRGSISAGRAFAEAEALLDAHWERVERCAYALSEQGTLTGSQV